MTSRANKPQVRVGASPGCLQLPRCYSGGAVDVLRSGARPAVARAAVGHPRAAAS